MTRCALGESAAIRKPTPIDQSSPHLSKSISIYAKDRKNTYACSETIKLDASVSKRGVGLREGLAQGRCLVSYVEKTDSLECSTLL